MSDANPERGEHELVLAGTAYKLRPSFAAIVAIERKLSPLASIDLLRLASGGSLSFTQIGIIASECIRAGAEDELTRRVSADKIGELAFEEGLASVMPVLTLMLTGVVNGGRTTSGEAKAPAAVPETGKDAGAASQG